MVNVCRTTIHACHEKDFETVSRELRREAVAMIPILMYLFTKIFFERKGLSFDPEIFNSKRKAKCSERK